VSLQRVDRSDDDGQTEPQPGAIAPPLHVGFEEMFDASFRKAAARILHLDDHVRVGVSGADFDRAPATRMFERVCTRLVTAETNS